MDHQPSRLTLADRVRVSDDVVFRELSGEVVLLNLATGIYYGLNDVGTRIWSLLAEEGSLESVKNALLRQYDVAPQQVEKDLLDLMEQLRSKGLIQQLEPSPA